MLLPRLVLAAVLLSGATGCRTAAPDTRTSLPEGLVAWWPLDGTGREATGRHHARVVGAASTADRYGHSGRALAFDGRGDYLSVPSRDFAFDLRQDSYTVALWVRAAAGATARLVQQWDESGQTPYPFSLQTTAGGIDAVVFDAPRVVVLPVNGVWDGAWHHVAVTFDARDGRLTAYRDGAKAGGTVVSVRRSTRTAAPLTMGGSPVAPSRFYAGHLDDVMVFARALAPAEVAALVR